MTYQPKKLIACLALIIAPSLAHAQTGAGEGLLGQLLEQLKTELKTQLKQELKDELKQEILAELTTPTPEETAVLSEPQEVCGIDIPQGYTLVRDIECQDKLGLIAIAKNGKQGYLDVFGNVAIEPAFDEAHDFDEGMALIKQNGKYGYITAEGTLAIAPQFDDAWGFSSGLAKADFEGKYGFIDKSGDFVIEPIFEQTGNWFAEGLVSVKLGGKWGFINTQGELVITPAYDKVDEFSEEKAVVAQKSEQNNGELRFQFIDKTGNVAIDDVFEAATGFFEKTAFVTKNGQLYYIDHQGKRVPTPNFDR